MQADARALPFRAGVFDAVISSFTICFVDGVESMLAESRRVLRRRGKFILGEITQDSEWGKLYSQQGKRGHRFYGKATFLTFRKTLSLLAKAGFNVGEVLGTIDFSPRDEPRIQSPVVLSNRDSRGIGRYGFVCVVAKP